MKETEQMAYGLWLMRKERGPLRCVFMSHTPSAIRHLQEVVPRDRIELSTPAFSGLCSAN